MSAITRGGSKRSAAITSTRTSSAPNAAAWNVFLISSSQFAARKHRARSSNARSRFTSAACATRVSDSLRRRHDPYAGLNPLLAEALVALDDPEIDVEWSLEILGRRRLPIGPQLRWIAERIAW